jgi:hypothetical protein
VERGLGLITLHSHTPPRAPISSDIIDLDPYAPPRRDLFVSARISSTASTYNARSHQVAYIQAALIAINYIQSGKTTTWPPRCVSRRSRVLHSNIHARLCMSHRPHMHFRSHSGFCRDVYTHIICIHINNTYGSRMCRKVQWREVC